MKDTLNFDTKGIFDIVRKKTLADKILMRKVDEGVVMHRSLKDIVALDEQEILEHYTVQDLIGAELLLSKLRTEVDLILSQCYTNQLLSPPYEDMQVRVLDGRHIWEGVDKNTIELQQFSAIVTGLMDSLVDTVSMLRSSAIKQNKEAAKVNEQCGYVEEVSTTNVVEPPSVEYTTIVQNIDCSEVPKKRKTKNK